MKRRIAFKSNGCFSSSLHCLFRNKITFRQHYPTKRWIVQTLEHANCTRRPPIFFFGTVSAQPNIQRVLLSLGANSALHLHLYSFIRRYTPLQISKAHHHHLQALLTAISHCIINLKQKSMRIISFLNFHFFLLLFSLFCSFHSHFLFDSSAQMPRLNKAKPNLLRLLDSLPNKENMAARSI